MKKSELMALLNVVSGDPHVVVAGLNNDTLGHIVEKEIRPDGTIVLLVLDENDNDIRFSVVV